jgi:monothiol glutaredoxin
MFAPLMTATDATQTLAKARIQKLVSEHPVVLFMKGTRRSPQCGFSSRVVDALDLHLLEYLTVDVLSDAEVREAVKALNDWPTLPQLFVRGTFVGGADIVLDMLAAGELPGVLGVEGPLSHITASVTVSAAAAAAFQRYSEQDKPAVRLVVNKDFTPELEIEPARDGDQVLDLGALVLAIDPLSARRADGMHIDFVEGPGATGFKIDNPNAPASVRSLRVEEYARWRQEGKPHLLLDVRTTGEVEIAKIEGGKLLDDDAREMLEELDRSTTLVLQCHHGIRSRAAAEHCIKMGFTDVHNLEGGIDAWSLRIDPTIPRY